MDNEQLLLNIFKQQHYDESQYKMQKTVMGLAVFASISGVILMSVFYTGLLYIYTFAVSALISISALILSRLKIISLRISSFIYMLYACFVLIPVYWYLTGITGSAPYISLTTLIAVLSMFSNRRLKRLLFAYLIVLFGLTLFSALTEIPKAEDVPSLVYTIAGYMAAVVLTTAYTLVKHKRFEELNDKFLRSSFRDELTCVYNRKLLDIIMKYEEALFMKEKSDYILVMFDVDDFKRMNDEHGHVFGDIVLRNVAKCISDRIRSSDFVVRYGGDEFLIIQTGATEYSLRTLTERLDEAISESCQMEIDISASYGFALRTECETPAEVLELADTRLYEMKGAHKNSEK